eukprot:SAG22_NODE_439_length_10489_cov_7.745813_2_plen_280_part_00
MGCVSSLHGPAAAGRSGAREGTRGQAGGRERRHEGGGGCPYHHIVDVVALCNLDGIERLIDQGCHGRLVLGQLRTSKGREGAGGAGRSALGRNGARPPPRRRKRRRPPPAADEQGSGPQDSTTSRRPAAAGGGAAGGRGRTAVACLSCAMWLAMQKPRVPLLEDARAARLARAAPRLATTQLVRMSPAIVAEGAAAASAITTSSSSGTWPRRESVEVYTQGRVPCKARSATAGPRDARQAGQPAGPGQQRGSGRSGPQAATSSRRSRSRARQRCPTRRT